MMFCQYCGSQLEENARFCSNCGQAVGSPDIGATQENQQQQPEVQPTVTQENQPRQAVTGSVGLQEKKPMDPRNKKMILQIFAGVFAAIFAVLFFKNLISFIKDVFYTFNFMFSGFSSFYYTVLNLVSLIFLLLDTLILLVSAVVCVLAGWGKEEPDGKSCFITFSVARVLAIAVAFLNFIVICMYGVAYNAGRGFRSFLIALVLNVIAAAVFYAVLFIIGQNPLTGINGQNFVQFVKDSLNDVLQMAQGFAKKLGNRPVQNQTAQSGAVQQGQTAQGTNETQLMPTAPSVTTATQLKTDRSLVLYILFTILTCGIYSWFFIYSMAKDVNTACEGDGDHTPGLLAFLLLSLITCGIYAYYWYYKLANRLAQNAPRYGMNFQENGTTVLLWMILGIFLCGIGMFVAMNILIVNTNKICAAYNNAQFGS